MKKLLLLTCIFLFTFSGFSQYDISFGKSENGIQVHKNTNDELIMSFNYAGINKVDVNTAKGTFTQLVLEGSYRTGNVGDPQMPSTKKLIQVPMGAELSVDVIGYDVQEYVLPNYGIANKILPFQPSYPKNMDPANQEFIYHESKYQNDEFTDFTIAQIGKVGILRGMNIAQVTVNPINYNPVTNVLRVYNNIEIKVAFKNGDATKTANSLRKNQSPYFTDIQNSIINATKASKDNYNDNPDHTNYPVKYLIVTDPAFENQLADFVTWKTKKGFEVTLVTTNEIGSTATDIKTWIHAQYNAATETDPAPTFFLLVGDVGQVPASATGGESNKKTDLYYACMDGDGDIIPDMYYGRFSAQTSEQLQAMLDKVLYYEKYEFSDASYLNDITLIAGADGTWNPDAGQPTINYGTNNYFNTDNGFSNVNAYLSSYSGCYDNERFRVSMINYTAHCSETSWGDPNLTISAVNAMENEGKYPLAIGNCCLAADFGTDECIGETWMRKANGGAVAYIGSSPSSYWYEDFYWSVGAHSFVAGSSPTFEGSTLGAYDAPYVSDYLCVDALIFVGNLAVTEAHDQGFATSITAQYYWEAYNCLSDPSLFIYLTEGKTNTVSHLPTLPIGVTEYEVSAEAGSYVAISKDGILHGAAIVPESGTVVVSIDPITTGGNADIVVTKAQYKPYIIAVPAAALDGPYLTVSDFNIIDESGNGNVELGESFYINLTLKNVGTELAEGVTASITTNDPYVESISNNTNIAFADIAADATGLVEGSFNVVIKDSVPDQHMVVFAIELTDNSAEKKVYEASKTVVLNAPKLELSEEITIDDTDSNGNGLLDPGETAKLTVTIKNSGHASVSASAELAFPTKNPYLTLISTSDDLGVIAAGEEAIAEFTVEADAATTQGTPVSVVINTEGGATPLYLDEKSYVVIIGQVPEVTIGDGTTESESYPFNNYYKNNKTQILYMAEEIGPGSKVITDIAFDISSATASAADRDLPNFSILMKLVDIESLSGETDMSNAQTVYSTDTYYLTGNTGWETFDFTEPFPYDGTSNLLIQVSWGQMDAYAGSTDRTKVNATTTSVTTVMYGQSDTQTPAATTASSIRPNLLMHVGQAHTLNLVVKDANGTPVEGATVVVATKNAITDANGQVKFVYAAEQYGLSYTINALGYYESTGTVDLNGESVTETITLSAKPRYEITFSVSSAGSPVNEASVSFNGENMSTDASGLVTFDNVIEENGYTYEVYKANYVTTGGIVDADASKTIDVVLNDDILTPSITSLENMREGQAKLSWTAITAPNFEDSFETYDDFARSFGEFTLIDADGLDVFGAEDYEYEDENGATAFRIMNYTATTPQWDGLEAHTGNKIAASFCANSGATPNTAVNDDWLITPQISIGSNFEFSFFAKSVTDQYGLERFRVKVSTTDTDINSFTTLSEGDYLEAPTTWTKYSYDMSAYFGQNIYVAIQCVSADAFVFMVDDMKCAPADGKEEQKLFEGYNVYLDDLTTPVATNIQDMEYIYADLTNGQEYKAGLKGIYSTGESELVTYDFKYSQVYTVDFHITIDGADVQGAEIVFNEVTLQTNSSGMASFSLESAEAISYTVNYNGYYEASGNINVSADMTEEVALIFIPDVTFTVVDQDDVVVEGAKISFAGEVVYTDATGKATFIDVEASENMGYRVSLSEYQTTEGSVTIGEEDVAVSVTIHELPEIKVVVKDIDNLAIQGARVYFNGGMILTDVNGVSEFANVKPSDDMPLKIRLSSYLTFYDTLDITLENAVFNVTLLEVPDVKLVATDGDNLLSGVSVKLDGITKTTDENGEALFVDIESGEYQFSANLNGYYEVIDTIVVETSNITKNINMAIIPDVTFTVEFNQAPMENIKVVFGGVSKYTNASGQAIFVDVTMGDHAYSISQNGYYPIEGICNVADTNMDMPMALIMIPDVSFTITDGINLISGAKVTFNGISKISNTEGKVSYTDIAAGKYAYSVEKDMYFTNSDSLTVASVDLDETIVMELENYNVSFNVTDGTNALENAFVVFNGETKASDVSGNIIFENVVIGDNYDYTVSKDGYEDAMGSIDVEDTDVTEDVALTLITYNVTFNVSDANGIIQGASVAFNNESLETNAEGAVVFNNVVPGTGLAYSITKDTHVSTEGTIDVVSDTTINTTLIIISINTGEQASIAIYPNPTTNYVNVDMGDLEDNFTITITDENGKIVKVIDEPQKLNQVDLSTYSKGVYFIKLSNNINTYIEKIVLK